MYSSQREENGGIYIMSLILCILLMKKVFNFPICIISILLKSKSSYQQVNRGVTCLLIRSKMSLLGQVVMFELKMFDLSKKKKKNRLQSAKLNKSNFCARQIYRSATCNILCIKITKINKKREIKYFLSSSSQNDTHLLDMIYIHMHEITKIIMAYMAYPFDILS